MALSSANVIQAKTGSSINSATASVVLDAGTTEGSTVIVELYAGSVPFTDGGLGGRVPDGFETDAVSLSGTSKMLYVFRKRDVAAGEGVAGSTPWDFTYIAANNWAWRVTEWDTGLDPVFPLETSSSNFATGSSPTDLSTGTTTETGRDDFAVLAWHHWHRVNAGVPTMSWSGHTNGFAERDELRYAFGTAEADESWSWAFHSGSVTTFETTATINLSDHNAADVFVALLVVYAEVIPEIVAGPTVMSG